MASQAFPKCRRLLKRREFRRVYDTGTPYRNAGFHLFLHPREDEGPARVGLTASRRLGKAVVRNRIRRWAREYFRRHWELLPPGTDLVLNFHPALARVDHLAFERLLHDVLRRTQKHTHCKKSS